MQISKVQRWAGIALTGLTGLFLLADAVMKLFKPRVVVEGTVSLGYPESTIIGMGLALLASAILYLIPRTAVLGAVLLTGYLGAAVATHVRVCDTWFNTLFPVLFGSVLWCGIWLRDERLRRLLPIVR